VTRSRFGSGARGSRGGRSSRSGFRRHARRDHSLTAATTANATTADNFTTAAARAAAFDSLAATSLATSLATTLAGSFAAAALAGRGSFAVALRSLLGTVLGEQTAVAALTTVATMAAMAAVAGDGTGVTADEGDGDQGEKHGNRNSEKTLHNKPPVRESNASCVPEAVTKKPRSGTATGPQQTSFEPLKSQPAPLQATGGTPP
jgi:hypothetical protein